MRLRKSMQRAITGIEEDDAHFDRLACIDIALGQFDCQARRFAQGWSARSSYGEARFRNRDRLAVNCDRKSWQSQNASRTGGGGGNDSRLWFESLGGPWPGSLPGP